MSQELVSYELDGKVATVTMDDGKVNVMSSAMQAALHAALDRAEADRAVVLLTGRPGLFSAGFDLTVLRSGGDAAAAMVRGGFSLAHRVLGFPTPVVVACPGHAIAMGTFLLLSGDYLVGAQGEYRLTANEVAIGLTLPHAGLAILRNRLTPAYLNRVAILAEPCSPANAVEAGYLDRVVPADALLPSARGIAESLAGLDLRAHAATKRRARQSTLDVIAGSLAGELTSIVDS